MHLTVTLPVVILACALALSACASEHPVLRLPTVDADCGAHAPMVRPGSILLGCADGSLEVERITWQTYGAAAATGRAVVHADTCIPSCADGGFRDYPAAVALAGVAHDSFTELTLRYVGTGPDGRRVASYPIQ